MEKRFLEGEIVREFGEDVETTRTVRFVISTDAKDRHKTRLNMNNWKLDNFNRNPIVGYQHDVYGGNMCTPDNPDNVLGPGRAWLETLPDGRKALMGEVKFETADINPLAEKIFRKVLNGTLRATSVGFLEIGTGKTEQVKDASGNIVDETYFFDGQELLEFSIVNIPSNPEATKKSLWNHTRSGVNLLRNVGLTIPQIRKIANEILDEAEKNEKGVPGPDPNLNKYTEKLKQLKNGRA